MKMADPAEVRRVIHSVEAGELRASPDVPWSVAWDIVTFRTEDGWQFRVFNDGGQWDYIDSVEASDGTVLCSPDIDRYPDIEEYAPTTLEAARRWGLSEEEVRLLGKATFE